MAIARNMNLCRENVSATRFKHIMINPSGNRFMFLYRRREGAIEITSLYTCDMDGRNLYCLETNGMVSHATWKDDNKIFVWASRKITGAGFYLFIDRTDHVSEIGASILKEDAHPSFSPSGRYILLDTYPDRSRRRTLYLFDMALQKTQVLGRFYSPFRYSGEVRCDLHPRWKQDGSQVCFDSAHEGSRHVYVMDIPLPASDRAWDRK
jgi:Tol biopolymer transport system component